MNDRIPALSIRQPWAWLIVNGYKDIENRTWSTKYRGLLWIHASKTATKEDYYLAEDLALSLVLPVRLPHPRSLETGGIIGLARLVDCVDHSRSPWFAGPQGFVLQEGRTIPFVPCPGRLGLFVPSAVLPAAGSLLPELEP